jgi:Bifunctional transglycosylase second domain
MRRLFSLPVLVPLVFIGAIVLGVLIYYWTVFSARIDTLLQGEVYTKSAGIYAAPKQLRVNENISQDEVVAFLKRAGYVEKDQQADSSRGRYQLSANTLEIEPSSSAKVDGQQQFLRVRVQFAKNGKSIASLSELDGHGTV